MYSALHAKGKNLCNCLAKGMRVIRAPKYIQRGLRGHSEVKVRTHPYFFCAVIKIYSVSLSVHKHLIIFDEVASFAA